MHTELIEQNSILFDAIATQDISEIGELFHSGLLVAASSGSIVPLTLYTLTPTKLISVVCDGITSAERHEQAKQFGRDSSEEFGTQPLHYIISQAMCFETKGDSGYKPNDDPNRTESCYTFVTPLLGLCLTSSMEEHMRILMNWNQRVWSHELHEGLPIKARYEDAVVVTSANKEAGRYDKDNPNIAVMDNSIISNAVIGMSPSFGATYVRKDQTPLQQAITLEAMKKRADKIHAEATAE